MNHHKDQPSSYRKMFSIFVFLFSVSDGNAKPSFDLYSISQKNISSAWNGEMEH